MVSLLHTEFASSIDMIKTLITLCVHQLEVTDGFAVGLKYFDRKNRAWTDLFSKPKTLSRIFFHRRLGNSISNVLKIIFLHFLIVFVIILNQTEPPNPFIPKHEPFSLFIRTENLKLHLYSKGSEAWFVDYDA